MKTGKTTILLVTLAVSLISFSYGLQSFVSIPSRGSIYSPPEVLFEDGFEGGDFSAWTGVAFTTNDNATIATTTSYDGSYRAHFQTDAIVSGQKYAYCHESLSPPVNEVYARGYFYITSGLPLEDDNDRFGLISFEVGGRLQCVFRVFRSGGVDRFSISGYNGSSTVSKSTDSIYPAIGRWYCIEFHAKIHDTTGEYRVWIDGVEQIAISDLNTMAFGVGVSRAMFGLTYSLNVQHYLEIRLDCVVIATRYIGEFRKYSTAFGVIGSIEENPAISNFYWLFGNQSISYKALSPSEVTDFANISSFGGLVIWTKGGYGYNATAIRQFAETGIIISQVLDFCSVLYPGLSTSAQMVRTNKATYATDWGNFRTGDIVDIRNETAVRANETGNINCLATVLASGLASFANVTVIASYDANRTAFFHMSGITSRSGFYVMDLDATTPETEWAGIWHLFPAIKMVQDFPTGRFARWMANGQTWWDLNWIYNRIDSIISNDGDIATKWVIGKSVQDRNITAIVIGKGERNIIIDGCIHGNEKTGAFASLRVAELLIDFYRSDYSWNTKLTQYRIIIIPVLNPDGFERMDRENANGVDLNRNFPPTGNASEPETRALINLMGNHTPIIYINMHEGWAYQPLSLWYGMYENEPYYNFTVYALRQAANSFKALNHWGRFTEGGKNVWIGRVDSIQRSGLSNSAQAYASAYQKASTMLIETFVWSWNWGGRQCLWALDFYPAVVLEHLEHYDNDEGFLLRSDGFITNATAILGGLAVGLDSTELTGPSTTVIQDLNGRGTPIAVYIDGNARNEGDGWTYNSGILTVAAAKTQIEAFWS